MSIIILRNIRNLSIAAGLALGLSFTPAVSAQITTAGPFTGDALEDFESFSTGATSDSFAIFGGAATLNKLSGGSPYIWPSSGWGLGSNGSAQAFDGDQGFGINNLATGEFIFDAPITAFGAYFGTAFTGDTVFLEFYDAGNDLIGAQQSWSYTRPGDGVLEWHGFNIGEEATRVVWGSLSATGAAPAIDSIRISTTAVPAAPEVAQVPALPVYGLVMTALGLMGLAGRRMRR